MAKHILSNPVDSISDRKENTKNTTTQHSTIPKLLRKRATRAAEIKN